MSVKKTVKEILDNGEWLPKGIIEDRIRDLTGSMGDTVSRRLREMVEDEELIKGTKMLRGREITLYRLKLDHEKNPLEEERETTNLQDTKETVAGMQENNTLPLW